jgi:hypothetical protein
MEIVAEQVQRLLTPVPEALYQLGIGRTKLTELWEAGELTAVKIGTRTFITQESINAFVSRLTQAATALK